MVFEPTMPSFLEELSYKRRLEKVAALLVEHVSGATLKELDPGGGAVQLPDFEILGSDGTPLGVLEVTTTTREHRARFNARARNEDWHFPNLMWSWSIHTAERSADNSEETDPRRLRRDLEPILRDLERSGPPEDWLPTRPGLVEPEPGSMPRRLAELGVIQAVAWNRHEEPGSAWVSVQVRIPGGFFASDTAMTREVQAELDKADNRAKLAGSHRRAELFVWLDIGDGAAAATSLSSPVWDATLRRVARPILPQEVTAVWAATGIADWPRPATSIFRCDGNQWEVFPRPILSFSGPDQTGATSGE
jgi:hypothetical protein